DGLASPLYRAEWARRGLSAAQRTVLRASSAVLDFRCVSGVRVDGGFVRLLYGVRATAPDGRPALSAWRVDPDPAGRVVWLGVAWRPGRGGGGGGGAGGGAGRRGAPRPAAGPRVAPAGGPVRHPVGGRARGVLRARAPGGRRAPHAGGVRGSRRRRRAPPRCLV